MHIDASAFFAALAHPLRLRSLLLLREEGELCVCELTHALDVAQPTISRHLAQLRAAGIVRDRREGLWIHYALHPELPSWARAVIDATAAGTARQAPFTADRAALAAMPDRPGGRCCA